MHIDISISKQLERWILRASPGILRRTALLVSQLAVYNMAASTKDPVVSKSFNAPDYDMTIISSE